MNVPVNMHCISQQASVSSMHNYGYEQSFIRAEGGRSTSSDVIKWSGRCY